MPGFITWYTPENKMKAYFVKLIIRKLLQISHSFMTCYSLKKVPHNLLFSQLLYLNHKIWEDTPA